MTILPVPFKEFIPKIYHEDPLSDALAEKADETIERLFSSTDGISFLRDPARAPAVALEEFGLMLEAGFVPGDSDSIRRQKIATAVEGHKRRSTWMNDAKPKVDAVAGGDSQLFGVASDAWWVFTDGTDAASTDWSAFGFDSENGFDGIILSGAGDEGVFQGNIRIDVDNAALTAEQVEQIKFSIEDSAPAYMRVILGYVSGGSFVEYANGRIE